MIQNVSRQTEREREREIKENGEKLWRKCQHTFENECKGCFQCLRSVRQCKHFYTIFFSHLYICTSFLYCVAHIAHELLHAHRAISSLASLSTYTWLGRR